MAALPDIAAALDTPPEVTAMVRREFEKHARLRRLGSEDEEDEDFDVDAAERLREFDDRYRELRLALMESKRATVLRLRHEDRIDDAVLRRIQAHLDLEQVRLTRETLL
jgi:CPA1 family monovalent cation:H+ antiporter